MKANIKKYEGNDAGFPNQWIIDTYGVEPGTEVELVDTKPFVSSYYNTPELPHYLCKLPNGTMKVIIATDLIIQEPKLEDMPHGVLYYEESEWAKFRREAAKDILCALISDGRTSVNAESVKNSIALADELIKQLKEK